MLHFIVSIPKTLICYPQLLILKVWLEVCSNPLLRITDLEKVVSIIKDFNKDIIIAVDNTFLTPFIVVNYKSDSLFIFNIKKRFQ